MIANTFFLLLLATVGTINVHSHPHPMPPHHPSQECADPSGIVYTGCGLQWKWHYYHWVKQKVCTGYTCEALDCDLPFAKQACPLTCGNCTTIVDLAVADPGLSTLVEWLTAADLVDFFDSPGPFTVFAPSNFAFDALNRTYYLEDQWIAHLRSLLLYHGLSGYVTSDYFHMEGREFQTFEGNTIAVTSTDPLIINDVEILHENITATNGVIHVVEDVLLPPSAVQSVADYVTDESREHFIGMLAELIYTAQYTDLFDFLEPLGPITVFAPTNEAFYKIHGMIDESNQTAVQNLLQNLVIPGILLSNNITDGLERMAGNEEILEFSVYHGHLKINDRAKVVKPDILVSNGVIHLIDEVLLPSDFCVDSSETYDGYYSCENIANSYHRRSYCEYYPYYLTMCPQTCGVCN